MPLTGSGFPWRWLDLKEKCLSARSAITDGTSESMLKRNRPTNSSNSCALRTRLLRSYVPSQRVMNCVMSEMKTLYPRCYPRLAKADRKFLDAFRREHDLPFWDVVGPHFTMIFGCNAVPLPAYREHVSAVAKSQSAITFSCRYAQTVNDDSNDNPSEHSSKVVTSGIYAYSRNPIYLGWFLFIAGIGFRNASLLVLAALIMILLLYWAVVLREEEYLEHKFGEEYLSYKKSVRRWW